MNTDSSPSRHVAVVVALVALVIVGSPVIVAQGTSQWDGAIGQPGTDGPVMALAVFDDGSGPAVYAGGNFTTAGGTPATGIARWDGAAWHPVGGGVDGTVSVLAVFDDGTGPALYAGGWFSTAGGVPADHIARWDGSSWSALGSGASGSVSALAIFDNGLGPALYVGGGFHTAGGVTVNRVARWDGSSWSALGAGVIGSGTVSDFAVFDDGTGVALYAAGDFRNMAGVSDNGIARWNGSSWASVGGGVAGAYPNVYGLAVFDDGNGEALYAAGSFTSAGGTSARRIARWNGQSWFSLPGGGIGTVGCCLAATLDVLDDGAGPALYAGGYFHEAGGIEVNRIARWDGAQWSALGSGMDQIVHAICEGPHAGEAAIYVGGSFTMAGGIEANHVARWAGAPVSADPPPDGRSGPVLTLYPNPASTTVTLGFEMPDGHPPRLTIFDLLGREVATVALGELPAGTHNIDLTTTGLPAGTYVFRLTTDHGATSRRLILIR